MPMEERSEAGDGFVLCSGMGGVVLVGQAVFPLKAQSTTFCFPSDYHVAIDCVPTLLLEFVSTRSA